MSFVERVYEKQCERTLKDVIEYANKRLTKPERAQLLILIADMMMVNPDNLVTASLDWRGKAE